MEKMFKYKMVNNDKCSRCSEVESFRNLWCGCRKVRIIWQAYNEYLDNIKQTVSKVCSDEYVFVIGDIVVVSKVKMKIIQEMIQVERPVNWSIENVKKIVNEIKNIELYNAAILGKLEVAKGGWGKLVSCFT